MKRLLLIFSILALTAATATALTPKQMNGRACNALLGPVKSVKSGDWTELYNRNGQFIGWNHETIRYTTVTSYIDTESNSKYTIRYTATTRTDQQTGGERLKKEYTFDSKGRLIKKHSQLDISSVETETNYYKGNDRLPYRTVSSFSSCGYSSSHDYTFEYLEFDSYGNWTKCKVTGVSKVEEVDESPTSEKVNTIWTRTIIYY